MFVVTLLANEVVAWMRRQPGTTSLRALFYMDEVFGYFPPTAMPPSKPPLLTLMKQARAFGVGVVLATQNPVDLDYKGLGNAGTWFIGRLQTERDKARVIEGLLGTDAAGGMDRAALEAQMSNLPQRTFLMRNVHDDAPVLLRTRWALSYLRGPLTLSEIRRLTPAGAGSSPAIGTAGTGKASPAPAAGRSGARPVVQAGVTERFLSGAGPGGRYEARVGARVRAHFMDAKAGVDTWESRYYLAPLGADGPDWARAEVQIGKDPAFANGPAADAAFEDVPGAALSPRNHKAWSAALADEFYRSATLETFRCPALKLAAAPGATEGEFRAQLAQALREKRDAAVDALRRKYAAKLATLAGRERRATQKVEVQKSQATSQTMSTALSVGGSLLGALFGSRRSGALRQASAAARSVGRASKERTDVANAEAEVAAVREQQAELEAELEGEIRELEAGLDPQAVPIETAAVKPRKAEVTVEDLALVWTPLQ
jgi:hypothetical protein